MRVLSRAAAALAVGAGLTLAPAAASAHLSHLSHRSQRSGYVYVNDNSAAYNSVAGFRRNSDGSLTPVPGSPFTTGGAGTGIAIGSQGSLQPAFGGRFVLAVDAGSNQISVLRVHGANLSGQWPGSARLRRAVSGRSGSPCASTWCTWPTPVPVAGPTTPGLALRQRPAGPLSRGRRTRCPMTPSRGRCCSTPPGRS